MRGAASVGSVYACLIFLPAAAYAQASITGVVRDSSGAVLPGVTVETTSAALIEKVRTVVTDGGGQYRIITLPPGTYTVTFTLPGFTTIRREGLELSGSFTATVNAELVVGGVEESILVTGESPLVDVQSATQQRVITTELIDAVPSGRVPANLVVLIPGIYVSGGGSNYSGFGAHDVGGAAGDMVAIYTIHGGVPQDSRMQLNGLSTGWGNEGWESFFHANMAAIEEVVVDTAGSAEVDIGGVRTNLIPREGGNRFSGTMFASFSNGSLSANNLDDDLRARGLAHATSVRVNGDFNPAFGGPIRQDRLWLFTAARYLRASNYVGGLFIDATQNDPSVFAYTPDPNRKAFNDARWKDAMARVTWQAAPRHKLAFSFHEQTSCKCPSNVTFTSPGGSDNAHGKPLRVVTTDWTAPITTRLLFDASVLYHYNRWGNTRPGLPPDLIAIDEQSTGMQIKSRNNDMWENLHKTLRYRFSMSYVTGAHAFKVGFVNAYATGEYNRLPSMQPLRYRTNNGVPNRITMRVRPLRELWALDFEPGLFVQDRWTVDRLTLNLGLRYDGKRTHFPENLVGDGAYGPARFVPVPFTIRRTEQLRWHDITPRTGVVYDLFGNGRTAVRGSLNKYMSGEEVTDLGNPTSNLVVQTTRSWRDANGDKVPGCDLLNPVANGECGAMANPNFGKLAGGAAVWDLKTLRGWGVRGYNWEFSMGVQSQILPRVSVDGGYFRRWYGNMYVTDDRALTAADFDAFSITAPGDSRLPGGGGYALSGLYDLKPASFGRPSDNYVTFTKEYGKQIQHWNGVDLSVNVRARDGLTLQGGLSTGRTSTDNCEIIEQLPEVSPSTPRDYCHIDTKFLTQAKFLGSFLIPRVDVQVSGSFQSIPGPELRANYVAPSAQVAQSLGRPLAGGEANVTVNLIRPGTMYGERLNQLDVRLAKIVRFGGGRSASLNLDLYNALNGNAVTGESSVFGNWRLPQNILIGRNLKISAQYSF